MPDDIPYRMGHWGESVDKLSPNFIKAYKALCFFLSGGRYEMQKFVFYFLADFSAGS